MPIPDYQAIMLPLLELSGDKKEHSLREATDILAIHFKLTKQERNSDRTLAQKTNKFNRSSLYQCDHDGKLNY